MKSSRKISLTRLHAINWYGYADSIPVEGNILLAGVTGSGKSILMDLLQFVLVGDRRLVKFNQSATGERSGRDLKGYVLGDIKEDEGGVAQYMRDSAITYAALEFTWPAVAGRPEEPRVETWGLRVEYTSSAEQQGRITPWWCEGSLERGDFLAITAEQKRVPRELADWKAFVQEREGEVFSGIEEYRRDMSSPGHLNFDHGILSRLLPTAMSFTFLRSFNDFCRLFILPPDKLNISDVTSSYRTFQRYEEELGELRQQLDALLEIRNLHQSHSDLQRDERLARYLHAEFAWKHADADRDEARQSCEKLKELAAVEQARLHELDDLIPQRRTEIDQLKDLIRQTPGGDTYLYIKEENQRLVGQIGQLRDIGNSLESALASRLRNARSWAQEVAALPLEISHASLEALEKSITRVEAEGLASADDNLNALREAAQKTAAELSRASRPNADRLAKIRQDLGALREEAAALKLGRLPFPARVLDALNEALPSAGNNVAARHLCQLCEVLDERWRPAIEVAFTRKFAIVVDEENYGEAERIYHALRHDSTNRESGRESLIHPEKALRLPGKVLPGSLAEKLKSSHPVAAAIIRHLFGNLICCDHREQLQHHEFAILPDGFMVRGAFVERTRHYDNQPFVGARGLELQFAWKEQQIAELQTEERRLSPLEDLVGQAQRAWREQFENAVSLSKQLAQIVGLSELEARLQANIDKLKLIDRDQFDAWEQQRVALEGELKSWETEQRSLLENQKQKDVHRAETALQNLTQIADKTLENFEHVKNEHDISAFLPRLDNMRNAMLDTYPVLEIAAQRFLAKAHECKVQAAETHGQLLGERRLFAQRFPRFNDLPIECADNDAHNRVLEKIENAEIRDYEQKSKEERCKWEHLFREQVLEKLRAALVEVKNILVLLNSSLNRPIGSSRYFIEHRKNPDFEIYHRMLDATAVAGSDLFASIADEQLRSKISEFLRTLVETPDGVEAARLLDYRHYFEYDMTVEDISQPVEQRRKISVDKQSGKFSGGENQSPYFIAILASYLRAYRRHGSFRSSPTLSLVPIDEAFSKLSGERIADCIDALAHLELQGVFSMSTGNIPYAFEKCDHLLVVSKEERRVGRKMKVRNVAVSITRESDEGRQFREDFS